MPARDAFGAMLKEAGSPLDPEAVRRLIRRTRPAWERPGVPLLALRIRSGAARGTATIVWNAVLDEPAAAFWRPARNVALRCPRGRPHDIGPELELE